MTSLTGPVILVMILGVLDRRGYGRALALGGVTAAGAALVSGGLAVPTFYAVALGVAVPLGLALLRAPGSRTKRQELPPGVSLLLAFLLWSVFVTLAAPILFDGQQVLLPTAQSASLHAGYFTSSNIAQTGYLVLGVGIVLYLGRSASATPQLIGLTTGLTIELSLWRYVATATGLPFPDGVFDNSPTFNFIETSATGGQRFRGILSEPAGLATACLVTISYMVPRAIRTAGLRRVGCLFMAVVAAFLGVVSTSATFVVAGSLLAVVVVATFGVGFLRRRVTVGPWPVVVGCLLGVVALAALPLIWNFVQVTIDSKVQSSSYNDRSSFDSLAYGFFLDTWGFGVGLGSTRASSFVPSLLSTTGFVGVLLFASAVVVLLVRGTSVDAYRPVAWALVSLLLLKIVSGPDLSDSSGVLWVGLGLLSQAAAQRRIGVLDPTSRVAPAVHVRAQA